MRRLSLPAGCAREAVRPGHGAAHGAWRRANGKTSPLAPSDSRTGEEISMFVNSEQAALFLLQRLDAGHAYLVRHKAGFIAVLDGAGEYRVGPGAAPYLEPWFHAHA